MKLKQRYPPLVICLALPFEGYRKDWREVQKNRAAHNMTLQVLVALCIGIRLNITVSEQLLTLRRYALSRRNPVHNAYRYLIERRRGISINDANELLTELFAGKGIVPDRAH